MKEKIKISKKLLKIAKQLIAISVSFNYNVPKNDILTCIYDFYMLDFLKNDITLKDYKKELQENNYIGIHRPDKIIQAQINVNEAYEKLSQFLKEEFMDIIYRQVARQFSHIAYYMDNMSKQQLESIYNESEMKFLNKYHLIYLQNYGKQKTLSESSFQYGNKIINTIHPDKIFFMKLAKKSFESLIKEGGYGGTNWANICQAYFYFFTQPVQVAIDHVFDLQHNTGNIFFKHPKYSELSTQVNKVLTQKRNAIYPISYINKCSSSIQEACQYLLYNKHPSCPKKDEVIQQRDNINEQKINNINNLKEEDIDDYFIEYIIDNNKLDELIKNNIMNDVDIAQMVLSILVKKNKLNKISKQVWNYISEYAYLTQSFIEKYKDKVNWHLICLNQILSENFVIKFKNKINLIDIKLGQTFSKQFYQNF